MERPGSLGKAAIFGDGNEVIVMYCIHDDTSWEIPMLFSYDTMTSIY